MESIFPSFPRKRDSGLSCANAAQPQSITTKLTKTMKNTSTVNYLGYVKSVDSIPFKLSRRCTVPPSIQECKNKNAVYKKGGFERYFGFSPFLFQCLSVWFSLATVPLTSSASDEHGRHDDPTGVWLTTKPTGPVVMNTFHSDGTFSGDVQGESAFVPGNESPGYQITSPEHGLWQKTGLRTLAATAYALEYNDDASFYAVLKLRLTCILNGPGDEMDITASGGLYDLNGNLLPGSAFQGLTAHFVRQRLEFQ